MFKKVLATFGVGGSKVDTILESSELQIGGELKGSVIIYGGDVTQEIDGIDFKLLTKIEKEFEEEELLVTKTIAKGKIEQKIKIEANEKIEIPINLDIPYHTPVSSSREFPIWLETSLDIDYAVDPNDKDYIKVYPSTPMLDSITSLEDLGFYIEEIDIEESKMFNHGFVQEFEFKPNSGQFGIDEIELFFEENERYLTVFIKKDSSSSFLEIFDLDESFFKFTIDKNNYSKSEIKEYYLEILNG